MGLRKACAKVSHHKIIFFRETFLTRPFLQQSISVRHSSFVESEDEDVEEEDVEDEPEPSAFNVACCRRRFRACLLRVRALADSFSSSDLFGAGMAWDLKDFGRWTPLARGCGCAVSIAIAKKGGVSGPWGNCSDKAGGPYAFLTHTLRVPYAKKHILFSKLVSWQQ